MPDGASLPQKIGRYDVKRLLASGAMGDVYQAATMDERTRTPVYHAIKVLNPKVAKKLPFVARFKSEIRDECLLEYKEIDFDSRVQDYFVSDYLEVKPVSRAVLRKERSPEILEIFARLAGALDKAHKKGVLHGNVKPSNVLIRRGKDDSGKEAVQAMVSDAGLTYLWNPEHFSGPRFRAVLPYMAPERIDALTSGNEKLEGVPPAADVYSLGAVLAETLSGRAPFEDASDLEGIKKLKRERKHLLLHVNHPVRRVDVRKLNDLLRRCLAAEPGARYVSAGELANALRACVLEPVKA
jgi:serine/threonine-protein kinase